MSAAGRLTVIVLAGLAGTLLIALATPRFVSGLLIASESGVIGSLSDGGIPSAQDLERAENAYQTALLWFPEGTSAAHLGAIRYAEARVAGFQTDDGRRLLDLSIATNRWAVEMNPVQPFAWTQMVEATLHLHGITADIDPLFNAAIATAPYSPKLVWQRAQLALSLWPFLGPQTRDLAMTQFRAAGRADVADLARLAHARTAGAIVRPALEADPEIRERFDRYYLLRRPF